MAYEEEYEIMPHKVIKELKEEIAVLKSQMLPQGSNDLTMQIKELNEIFSRALRELDLKDTQDKTSELNYKVDELLDENQKIAAGIVSLADMLREEMPKIRSDITRLENHVRGLSNKIQQPRMERMPSQTQIEVELPKNIRVEPSQIPKVTLNSVPQQQIMPDSSPSIPTPPNIPNPPQFPEQMKKRTLFGLK